MEAKEFTRKELYDLVWSKPLTVLAKEFSYSDNGLRKLCKKHDILLPYIGYWQKIQYKKKVRVLPFVEKENDKTKIKLEYRKEGEESINQPNSERTKLKRELENDIKLTFKVPDKLINTDPLIKAVKIDLKNKQPSLISGKQRLLVASKGCLDIEVSKKNVRRALIFMNSFIGVAKKRGHTIAFGNDVYHYGDGTYININGEPLKIRVREILKRVPDPNDPNYTKLTPTGILTFRTGEYSTDKMWRDTEEKLIEEQLLSIFIYLEIKAKKEKEERINRDIQCKKWEEERKQEEELRKRRETELLHFKELLETATRWHKAEYLRKFISAIEEKGYGLDFHDDSIKNPLQWARDKADWYDPLVEKEDELLKDVNRDTLK